MTEADKPNDHDAEGQEPVADAHAETAAEAEVATAGRADEGTMAGNEHAVAGAEAPTGDHVVEATTEHVAEVEAVADGHGVQGHGDHVEEISKPAPAEETAALAVAPVAAAASASRVDAASPIWSDHGDAPDHSAAAPVYKPRKEKKAKSGGGNEFVEIVKTVFFALLIAVLLRIVLFQPFTIPSASMEPNLYEGDYIVVSKWSYGYSKHAIPFSPPLFEGRILGRAPERGDIAVFKLPRDNSTDYIKRVIGVPGDRVQMIDGMLHINGEAVRNVILDDSQLGEMFSDRPAIQIRETLPDGRTFRTQDFGPGNQLDSTPVFEVPQGHYFMMGDNRDNSVDSRVDMNAGGVGLVPEENLIGKAEIILFSWSEGASLFNPISWFSKVRLSRFFTDLD
jgi:signal peptidase I